MRRRFSNTSDSSPNYLSFTSEQDNSTISLISNASPDIKYSLNDGNWVQWDYSAITLNTSDVVYMKGNNSAGFNTPSLNNQFRMTGKIAAGGNIMSLLYEDDFEGELGIPCEYCYSDIFSDCTSLTTAPKLPATTLSGSCYYNMFSGCTSLTIAPKLPATTLASFCYYNMFSGCTSLTTVPKLPATTLADYCYSYMFSDCTSLTTAPELPATTLSDSCYYGMFYNCSKLNYIEMLATDISASFCLNSWVYGVANSGTFVKNIDMISLPSGTSGIPNGWTIKDNFTPSECTSLTIIADNVSGRAMNTTIYYTAVVNGTLSTGESANKTITGSVMSENFPQNTSETEEVPRTISYTYMGVTATTTIIQGVWVNSSYTLDLNSNWQLSTSISNPDSSTYDGVYESYSNKGIHNTAAIMYIDIDGYENFSLYIRSYTDSEGDYDYVMVSQLDASITNSTSYSNTSLVKAHTRGSQTSSTAISNHKLVKFTGIGGGKHRITVLYRKDGFGSSGDDRGYLLIPINQ